MSMNKYYQNELDKLRDQATEFAQAHPTIAPQLAQASSDPDVERILEGVAFLSGQIRQKIDDDFPEFSQGLLKQIFPHYLRPVPSATLMQFHPKDILKNHLKVEQGSFIDSQQVEGVNCRFSTVFDLDVYPMQVSKVASAESSSGRKQIEVSFSLNGLNVAQLETDSLQLYLGGDYQGAVELFYLLLNCVDQIDIVAPGQNADRQAADINIDAPGFDDTQSLIGYPGHAFPSYRLIQEYFTLKQKFLFIRLSNLKQSLSAINASSFTLRFVLKDQVNVLPRMNPERFMLHVTPAINLFKRDAEAILNDHRRSEYRVLPLRSQANQYHIYSVDAVRGQSRRSSQQTQYRDIGLANPDLNDKPAYQIIQRDADAADEQVFISFSYPPGFDVNQRETLSIELTCSNGEFPSRLKPGDISKPTSSTSDLMTFENILQPSDYQHIPQGSSMLWRLLSHLSLNYLSLADTENLKALLGLYIFSGSTGNAQEVANRKRIEGIRQVEVSACDGLYGGIAMRGQAINVRVNPANFSAIGDMYLFGALLDRLFASFASINCFTRFSLTDEVTEEVYRWTDRTGDRPLI